MSTQKEIAEHLDLVPQRIQQLQQETVIPRGASLDVARINYIRFLRASAMSGRGSGDVNEERARLIHHQANLASLEEDVKQGKLIPADEIEKEWVDMSILFR